MAGSRGATCSQLQPARTNQIAQGVDRLPQVALPASPSHGRPRRQRLHRGRFDVGHVAWVTLGLAAQLCLLLSVFVFFASRFYAIGAGNFQTGSNANWVGFG